MADWRRRLGDPTGDDLAMSDSSVGLICDAVRMRLRNPGIVGSAIQAIQERDGPARVDLCVRDAEDSRTLCRSWVVQGCR